MNRQSGFTLIELSIVLVIIGLIIGGVLVGQDLVRAAGVRATISQIEKYQSAVNTFREKYGALPGDLNALVAKQFGFTARGVYLGEGDGNGNIEGIWSPSSNNQNGGLAQFTGETALFWEDLSYANGLKINLIEGSFSNQVIAGFGIASIPLTAMSNYLPTAKIGRGNYFYVWNLAGVNYYGISVPTGTVWGNIYTNLGLSVKEAYDIDKKTDDGLPQSGRVTSVYVTNISNHQDVYFAGTSITHTTLPSYTTATTGSSSTCFDNSTSADGQTAVDGTTQHYSLEINNGTGVNCALSFQFQ